MAVTCGVRRRVWPKLCVFQVQSLRKYFLEVHAHVSFAFEFLFGVPLRRLGLLGIPWAVVVRFLDVWSPFRRGVFGLGPAWPGLGQVGPVSTHTFCSCMNVFEKWEESMPTRFRQSAHTDVT